MEWITTIFGFLGGGWGSFAAILAGAGLLIWLRIWYRKWQDAQSHQQSQDQFVHDHSNSVINGQGSEDQANQAQDQIDQFVEDKKPSGN